MQARIIMLEPSEDVIRSVAYDRWEKRGRGDGFATADWMMAKRFLRFVMNYTVVAAHDLISERKTFLGRKEGQICRFCRRGTPDGTFRKDAHAVSHFFENNSLFSNYECDECNAFFGDHLEDHLGKFTLNSRVVSQMHGKNGAPIFRADSKKTRIGLEEGKFNLRVFTEDDVV